MSDINNVNQTYDAQQAAEEIAEGDRPAPQVDVSSDYQASKEYSVSEVDRTGKGQEAAEAATAPQFEVSQPEETKSVSESTGDPSDYRDMAKDISGTSGSTGNVSDDLVKKAIEMGQPGQ
ncbi:hypothetical protein [Phormidesmis priestleyi]